MITIRRALTVLLLAGCTAPVTPGLAADDTVSLGTRNPAGGAAAGAETQIIADTGQDHYSTRQSNTGAGGGAIYGCRSSLLLSKLGDPAFSTPCLRVNNLRGGKAFDFAFDSGPLGGVIQSGGSLLQPNPKAAPFVTNATAVALGLNADRVDGRHASELITAARIHDGLDADKLDGKDASAIIAEAQQSPSACPTGTMPVAGACLEQTPRAAQTFTDAAATCGAAGRRLVPAAVLEYARTVSTINLGTGEMAADITAPTAVTLPVVGNLTQPPAYATVSDDGTIASATPGSATAFRCTTA